MFSRKRSSNEPSSYCKRSKVVPEPTPMPSEESIDGANLIISENDWLTAICQSLGDVPAVEISPPSTTNLAAVTTERTIVPTPSETSISSTAVPTTSETPRTIDEVTTRKSTEVLREWNLGDNLVVSLHRIEWKLHVHIRKNSQHIVMTVPTYRDFKNQLSRVSIPFERPSIICNNQLAVFTHAEKRILQQIFHFEHFKLKNTSLELEWADEGWLAESFKSIDEAIKVAIFESVLPKQFPKMNYKINPNCDPIDLLEEFMSVVNEEISRHVDTLFVCYGCQLSSPGQKSHDCITVDYLSKCSMVGEDSILLINPRRIANVLNEKGILNQFNYEFFNLHKYDEIRSLMEM